MCIEFNKVVRVTYFKHSIVVWTEFMSFALKFKYNLFLVGNSNWAFEQGFEFKSVFSSHNIDVLIGDIVKDKGRHLDLFTLYVFVNVLLLHLYNILGCKYCRQHLRGNIDFEWRSFLIWWVCFDVEGHTLLFIDGKGWVCNCTLERLYYRLPSWRSWVEKI